jgi:AcrR family transcriptional regulator
MVRSAAYLFRERGYSGTGFRDVITHSGAPRGSIYHHFPGGKAQLAEEAVRYAGEFLNAGILAATEGGDAASAVDAFVGWWRQVLIKSEFRAGCPVVAVTAISVAIAAVPDDRASRLARLIVAAVEGATILCRAHRDVTPLDDVVSELKAMARSAAEEG